MKRRAVTLILAAAAAGAVSGCAAPPIVGEIRDPAEGARVEAAAPRYLGLMEMVMIHVHEIDGIEVPVVRWNDAFVVSPGPHAAMIIPMVKAGSGFRGAAPRFMVFETKPGRTYVVDGERTDSGWRVWIADQASGEKIAELPSPDQPSLTWDPEPVACAEYLTSMERAGAAGEGTVAHLKQTLPWREFAYMTRRWTQEASTCDILAGARVDVFLDKVSAHCRENAQGTFGSAVEAVAKSTCR